MSMVQASDCLLQCVALWMGADLVARDGGRVDEEGARKPEGVGSVSVWAAAAAAQIHE